jgi:hypothetical protein
LLVVAGFMALSRPGLAGPTNDQPFVPHRSHLSIEVVNKLRSDGAVITDDEADAVAMLVGRWEARADLREVLSTKEKRPDVTKLLMWAAATRDPDVEAVSAYRPELLKLTNHLGLVAGPEAATNNTLIDAMLAIARNGQRRFDDPRIDIAVTQMALEIDARPDVKQRVVKDGRVDLDSAIRWALTVPLADPSYDRMYVRRDGLQKLQCLRRFQQIC